MSQKEEEDLRMEITFYKFGILVDKELVVWECEDGGLMAEVSLILPVVGRKTMAPKPIDRSRVRRMTKKYFHTVDWR